MTEDQRWDGNTKDNGKQTFYQYEKLLKFIQFCLCEVTAVVIATISYLPAKKIS